MATRSLLSGVIAGGVTFLLFWTMTALIAVEDVPSEPRILPTVEIVEVRAAQEPIPPERFKPVRHEIEEQPLLPELPNQPGPGLGIAPAPRQGTDPFEGERRLRPALGSADGDATPLVRIAPRYPDRALARGIEGRVLVEFTINRSGSVEDARVIASEPASVFDKAALEAVRQWRYSPKIVNGNPVERRGVRISIPFRRQSDRS